MNDELLRRYPSVADLERRARLRIPHFVWEFVDSGTGLDQCAERNRKALSEVLMIPQFMKGPLEPNVSTTLFGVEYNMPFGVSPVGMSGLIWPRMEQILTRSAAKFRFPYALSTFSNEPLEAIGALSDGMGWFQLYPPRNSNIRSDLLGRAREAGFTTLVVTADVPMASRRERQARAGVGVRSKITLSMLGQGAVRPAWALATLRHGLPRFPVLQKYVPMDDMKAFLTFLNREFGSCLDWDYLRAVRREWDGPIVLKGVLDVEDAKRAVDAGLDGIVVSNHGGRQFDGAPATISLLPAIAEAVGARAKIVFDGGVFGGLDIARALALGADFVMLGRAFMYGVAALGEGGGDHAAETLLADLNNNMVQLGCASLDQLAHRCPAAVGPSGLSGESV